MTDLDPRTPVLVGAGTCFDDVEALELMNRSAEAAGADAGSASLLSSVGRVVVGKGTWSYKDPGRVIRERIGAPGATSVLSEVGIPQQQMINEVLELLMGGDIEAGLIVGGEAKARAARMKTSSTKADAAGIVDMYRSGGTAEARATETDQGDVEPDIHQHPDDLLVDMAELAAGLFSPVEQYAMIEYALGAADGLSLEQLRADVAVLHARFNEVAQEHPHAAFPARMTAEEIFTFSESNRPMAFPYAKWHVTQWTVDQAAALLLTTVGAAERHGVPRDRWVFPLVGLTSSQTVPLSQRAELHRWPAMKAIGEAAEAHLGFPVSECGLAELYSCFPVAVRVQQRELGFDPASTPTLTGGMAFGGGPFNSFQFQALPTLVAQLRAAPGSRGVSTSVSGLLTKPGLSVWSSEPGDGLPLVADVAERSAELTETRTVLDSFDGEATVATLTVTYDGQDPKQVIALLDTPDDERVIAKSTDASIIDRATHAYGMVGEPVKVSGNTFTA